MYIRTILLLGYCSWAFNTSGVDGQPPLNFTENKGQVSDQHYQPRPDVRFYGSQGPMDFHITDRGISYQLRQVESWRTEEKHEGRMAHGTLDSVPDRIRIRRVDINWPGIDPNAPWVTSEPMPDHTNYYLEVCPDGVTGVRSFGTILRRNIYPGVDLKYYSKDGRLKYDYIVAPGTSPDVIRLEVYGAEVSLLPDGSVKLNTPLGDLFEEAPLCFQQGKVIKSAWVLSGNTLTFHVPDRDPTAELVIDPAIRTGGTYFGGNLHDEVRSIQPLTGNDLMIAGITASLNMIATSGAFDVTHNGSFDAFVARMTNHTARVWGTYFGGSGNEELDDLHLRFNDRTAVTGHTSSISGIASPAAYQGNFGGGTFDAFIVWFNNANGQRTYGTYFGGAGNDYGFGIASDTNGDEYLVGQTSSTTGISTPGSFMPSPGSGFLAKLDASGGVVWSTYLPGVARKIALAPNGSIFLCGSTSQALGVATPGTHQTEPAGNGDAYLMRFTLAGQRIWGTYYGGERPDFFRDLSVDPFGNVIACGATNSQTGIATFGAPLGAISPGLFGNNGLVVKFNDQGQRIWGRYYSGLDGESTINACAVDDAGSIYIGGVTSCYLDLLPLDPYSSIISSDGLQISNPGLGIRSGFLARLDPNGERMYGSYYGGFLEDEIHAVAVTPQGRWYIAGEAQQDASSLLDGFLLTPGAWDVTAPLNDSREGFYAIFCTTLELFVTTTNPSCAGVADGTATVFATGGGAATSYSWTPAPGGGSGTQVTGLVGGITYQVTGNSILGTCSGSASSSFTLTSPLPLVANIQEPGIVECFGSASGSLDLDVTGGTLPYTFDWSNGGTSEDVTDLVAGNYSVTITDGNGCTTTTGSEVTEPAPIILSATVYDEMNGSDGSIDLQVSGGVPPYTYTWSNGSNSQDIADLAGGVYSVVVMDANDCTETLEVVVSSSVGVLEIDNGPAWMVALDGGAQLLIVSADMPFNAVELLDASGRMIHSKRKVGLIASMDVGHLSSGVYLVRIVLDEGPRVKRLFIGR
jgi:hypothetical protein